ncbi:MAG: transcription antitermination factor NusB [Acidobacteriota bacterium]|nr:transcription antitermination factor NusB [Acidobacteriota bacterium]
MGKRSQAREMALQMLYQAELGEVAANDVLGEWPPLNLDQESDREPVQSRTRARRAGREYAETLVRGVTEHLAEVDDLIRDQASNWRLERMPAVDRTVLRIATYELLFEADVPRAVVLDEAIELAKSFGSEQSGAFVNGVLDGLIHARQFPGKLR